MSIKVMSKVWEQSKQKGSALLLLLAIADHAADDGYCWPSIEHLKDKIRMSARSVSRLVADLEADGELYVVRSNANNRYVVTVGMSKAELSLTLASRKQPLPPSGDDNLACPENGDDNLACRHATSDMPDMPQLCHANHHEPSRNRKKTEHFSVGQDDVSGDWPTDSNFDGQETTTKTPSIQPFKVTGDVMADMVQAAKLREQRDIPDWAIKGPEGPNPYFEVLLCFCKMTGQSVEGLNGIGKTWLDHLEQFGLDNGLSPGMMVKAHKVLPNKEWGQWYLEQHQWTNPMVTSYMERLRVAAGQVRDGTLKVASAEGWSRSL